MSKIQKKNKKIRLSKQERNERKEQLIQETKAKEGVWKYRSLNTAKDKRNITLGNTCPHKSLLIEELLKKYKVD